MRPARLMSCERGVVRECVSQPSVSGSPSPLPPTTHHHHHIWAMEETCSCTHLTPRGLQPHSLGSEKSPSFFLSTISVIYVCNIYWQRGPNSAVFGKGMNKLVSTRLKTVFKVDNGRTN